MSTRGRFFPKSEPTEAQLVTSRRLMLAEYPIANIIFTLGTSNFAVSFLGWLGATPAMAALVIALPQLGNVLQLVAPLLFERLRHRKLAVWLICLGFKVSLSVPALLIVVIAGQQARLAVAFACYFIAFMLGGFATPGLNNWMLSIAPRHRRGRFFAWRDITTSIATGVVTLMAGVMLDGFSARGMFLEGYVAVALITLLFTIIDMTLLGLMWEIPATGARTKKHSLLLPLHDKEFMPLLVFLTIWNVALGFSFSFQPMYQLQVLNLSHSFITFMGLLASVLCIATSWLWGRIADCSHWNRVMLGSGLLLAVANLGWFLLPLAWSAWLAPMLHCLWYTSTMAFNMATLNVQFIASPRASRITYLGVTAAIYSTLNYFATVCASALQARLALVMGDMSIRVLFLISAVGMLVSLLYGKAYVRADRKAP